MSKLDNCTRDQGYFMVPQQLSFAESVHVCRKLSGAPISYTNTSEFLELVYHLSLASNMRAAGCTETLEDGSSSVQVWAGGSDEVTEGVWTTWDTRQDIQVDSGHFVTQLPLTNGDKYLASTLGGEQTVQ